MKVLLTGATGLLGGAFLPLLLERDHDVRCLVRRDSPNLCRLEGKGTKVVRGDARSEEDLRRALGGVDACVHVAGIEFAPALIPAMRRAGIGRLLAVSSTSAHSAYPERSGPKLAMEKLIRESDLSWTVVRPSMIYGSELDRNVSRLLRFLDRSPVFPVFGPGTNLWQPVYHEDLARGVLAAFENPATIGQTYDLPGREPLAYTDLVKTAADALGRKARLVRIPLEPARQALRLAELAKLPLPVSSEQVMRLREDKAYPYEEARRDLGYAPRGFAEGVALEAGRLRELGMIRA